MRQDPSDPSEIPFEAKLESIFDKYWATYEAEADYTRIPKTPPQGLLEEIHILVEYEPLSETAKVDAEQEAKAKAIRKWMDNLERQKGIHQPEAPPES